MANSWKIKESGRTGEVYLQDCVLVRQLGIDVELIPIQDILSIRFDHKWFRSDILKVRTGSWTYSWKVPYNGDTLMEAIVRQMQSEDGAVLLQWWLK